MSRTSFWIKYIGLSASLVLAAACGDDEGANIDAAMIDAAAPPDAPPPPPLCNGAAGTLDRTCPEGGEVRVELIQHFDGSNHNRMTAVLKSAQTPTDPFPFHGDGCIKIDSDSDGMWDYWPQGGYNPNGTAPAGVTFVSGGDITVGSADTTQDFTGPVQIDVIDGFNRTHGKGYSIAAVAPQGDLVTLGAHYSVSFAGDEYPATTWTDTLYVPGDFAVNEPPHYTDGTTIINFDPTQDVNFTWTNVAETDNEQVGFFVMFLQTGAGPRPIATHICMDTESTGSLTVPASVIAELGPTGLMQRIKYNIKSAEYDDGTTMGRRIELRGDNCFLDRYTTVQP